MRAHSSLSRHIHAMRGRAESCCTVATGMPPKDRWSDAPSEGFDVYVVMKLHQESMAGCVRLLIITQGIFMHSVDFSEHSIRQCKAYSSRRGASIMRRLSSSPGETAGYLRRRICSGAQAAMLLCITQVMSDRMISL